MTKVKLLTPGQSMALGEGPIWDPKRDSLWWVDVAGGMLWRRDHNDAPLHSWAMPKRPVSLCLLQDGNLLVVFRRQIGVFDTTSERTAFLECDQVLLPTERFNDCRARSHDELWVGSMDMNQSDPVARVFRVRIGEDSLDIEPYLDGFCVSNGMAWSVDGKEVFVVESSERQILSFPTASGLTHKRQARLVRQYTKLEMPDGLTVDQMGNIWVAVVGPGRIDCLRPDGSVLKSHQLGISHPTSCTFGGSDLATLYVTSMHNDLSNPSIVREQNAGCLFGLEPGAKGCLEKIISAKFTAHVTKGGTL